MMQIFFSVTQDFFCNLATSSYGKMRQSFATAERFDYRRPAAGQRRPAIPETTRLIAMNLSTKNVSNEGSVLFGRDDNTKSGW
ncbi:MAG TPA: hypothetical protein DCM07_06830 [Planctomycetaceae bacterium]|nr:hypothetical protein [Gimesia sp.]HAH44562.1 hypothetical protein [Planctomycetaceae bacterium]HBL46486.1 hypothetical protein [Planctomycetaceae bacterium]